MEVKLAHIVDGAIGAVRTRRAALGAAIAAIVAVPALVVADDRPAGRDRTRAAAKKKPKKCKAPSAKCGKKCCNVNQACVKGACKPTCRFDRTETIWTLLDNCDAPAPITLPPGVSFIGNGYAIASKVAAGAVLTMSGPDPVTVDGLMIDSPVSDCDVERPTIGLALRGPGILTNLRLTGVCRGIALTNPATALHLVEVHQYTADTVDIGVWLEANVNLDLQNSQISRAVLGVASDEAANVSITNVEFANNWRGIALTAATGLTPAFTISSNAFYDNDFGVWVDANGGSATTDNNTVQRLPRGVDQGFVAGITYLGDTEGSISNNEIWGYRNRPDTMDGCGISVRASVPPEMTIGANSFPSPPGNHQNVCDAREP